ncbi:hypothetical protein N8I77_000126 [Diaporthe amygdali]|uniref:Clr5 domain-containing protein n=1 Tax=Phomopsis amygdali TaxID=1214568 RepID=A0AAD9SNX9_PHOAM|nr:hypothetical protein N8I77_000126 [Diaporthe amygdali]
MTTYQSNTEQEWERHKEVIKELYCINKLRLQRSKRTENEPGVVELMKERYGFHASPAQYESQFRKWGLVKNLKNHEWATLILQYDLVSQTKEDVRITVSGSVLSKEKIDRARRRYVTRHKRSQGAVMEAWANFNAVGTLPPSRQAFVEFCDGTGNWSKFSVDQANHCNTLVLHNRRHLESTTSPLNDHIHHQDHLAPQVSEQGLGQTVGEDKEILTTYESDPVCPPFSPSFYFTESFTNSFHRPGTSEILQNPPMNMDDHLFWNYTYDFGVINESLDIEPFLLEKPAQSSIARSSNGQDDCQDLITKRPSAATIHEQGARSFAASLIKDAKIIIRDDRGFCRGTELPDAEDIIESLESLIPADRTSPGHSGLALLGRNTTSSSHLFKALLYSFTNNFAGLRGVPRKSLLRILREHREIRTQMFEVVKSGPSSITKSLADNLFRAAVEGCDPDAVATIIHRTRDDPRIAIDPNEIACYFEGRDYTPIELAAKFRNIELVRILVASRADPNKSYADGLGWKCRELYRRGALDFALGRWQNGREYPYKPPSVNAPAPVNLDLLRMLLDCGAKVCIEVIEHAIRPGPGHMAVAEELIARIIAADHRICFRRESLLVRIVNYLENSGATRIIMCLFAHCSNLSDCGQCASKNPRLIETMLSYAARRANLELTKFLVQHTDQLQSALAAAIRGGDTHLINFLLDKGARVNDRVRLWQSKKKDLTFYELYDEGGYDLSESEFDREGSKHVITLIRTPLAEAIRAGDEQLTAAFESRGALTRLIEKHHFHAAVLAAAEVGNISYLNKVLEYTSKLRHEADLTLALAVAIRNDETEAALALLDAGAKPSSIKCARGFPFINALQRRNKRVVNALLECDVAIDTRPNTGQLYPMEVAGAWGDVAVIEDLVRMGASIDHGLEMTALVAAVKSRNQALVHRLLELGADPGAKADKGTTPLQAAVEIGDYAMVHLLLSKGATPANSQAISYAMENDLVGFELLLSAFRSRYPDGLRDFGGVLLAKAVKLNDSNMFDGLIRAGIDVNSRCREFFGSSMLSSFIEDTSKFNMTVLGFVVQNDRGKDYELVRKLIKAGADVNCTFGINDKRWSPEMFWNFRDLWVKKTETPLHLAIKEGNAKMVNLLIEYGSEINRPPRRGVKHTPLQSACEAGSYEMVKLLLVHGAKANDSAAERHGGTALQMAAKTGSIRIVKLLLDNGADPHMAKSKVGGRTAFEAAAENGCIDILCLLWNAVLPHGFDEKECESAKGLAKQKGHRGCVDFIAFLQSNDGSGSCQSLLGE